MPPSMHAFDAYYAYQGCILAREGTPCYFQCILLMLVMLIKVASVLEKALHANVQCILLMLVMLLKSALKVAWRKSSIPLSRHCFDACFDRHEGGGVGLGGPKPGLSEGG